MLLISSWYPSNINPNAGIFVEDQARALSAVHDVCVIAPVLTHPLSWSWRRGSSTPVEERNGIPIYRPQALLPVPRRLDWRPSALCYLASFRATFDQVRLSWGTPDLIHAHVVLLAGWAGARLGRSAGIPVVLTEHTGPFSMNLGSQSARSLTNWALRHAARVIAVSPSLRSEMLAFCPSVAIDVVGNVVDTNQFRPSDTLDPLPHAPVRFAFVGALTRAKGVDVLLEATAQLSSQTDQFDVLVAGDGPDAARLRRRASALAVDSRLHFLGQLTRTEVLALLRSCDVLVLPSLHESFGVVLAEAMACGKPVIATRCGGPEHFITEATGLLVTPGSVVELFDAMNAMLSRAYTYRATDLHDTAVRLFSPATFTNKISEIYRTVLSGLDAGS